MKTLKFKGLKKACGETKSLGRNDGHYIQLSYDLIGGEILIDYHCNFGHNSWTEYNSPKIIHCGFIDKPATMDEIKGMIEIVVCDWERHLASLPN